MSDAELYGTKGRPLPRVSYLAGWPTPQEADGTRGSDTLQRRGTNYTMKGAAKLAGWSTPTAQDAARGDGTIRPQDTGHPLPQHAALAGWPTPKAQEDGRTLEQYEAGRLRGYETRKGKTSGGPSSKMGGLAIAVQLTGPARLTVSGEMLTGSDAGMPSGGQLSPDHSLWLMGIPAEWVNFAPQATRSLRPKRKPSSKPRKTSSTPRTRPSIFD
jgi:hypothetical protein